MKKISALALSTLLILNSTSFAFSDLNQTHWAYNNVMNMQNSGIISGFTDNTFRPDDSLTRDQFITLAVKGLNVEKPDIIREFKDSSNRWSEEFIKIAGYTMTDYNDTVFRPDDVALREDVAMSIVRLNNLEKADYDLGVLNKFSDRNSISESRKKYVAIAVENGFMSGNADGTFAPKKALTRAEGATVVLNMLNKVIEGTYLLGEELDIKEPESIEELKDMLNSTSKSLSLDIANISSNTADFTLSGIINGDNISVLGKLQKQGDKWLYLDSKTGSYTIQIELKDNSAIVTGLNYTYNKLNGKYIKK